MRSVQAPAGRAAISDQSAGWEGSRLRVALKFSEAAPVGAAAAEMRETPATGNPGPDLRLQVGVDAVEPRVARYTIGTLPTVRRKPS